MNKPIKIILLGDKDCGKTTLKEKFIGRGFSVDYMSTIGADFALKQVKIASGKTVKIFTVQVWDIAYGSAYLKNRNLYYKETKGIIAVLDLTRQESFTNLMNLLKELKKVILEPEKIPVVLIGNKKEQRNNQQNQITYDLGLQMALKISKFVNNGKIKTNYLETSTLTGENIGKGLSDLVETIVKINSLN